MTSRCQLDDNSMTTSINAVNITQAWIRTTTLSGSGVLRLGSLQHYSNSWSPRLGTVQTLSQVVTSQFDNAQKSRDDPQTLFHPMRKAAWIGSSSFWSISAFNAAIKLHAPTCTRWNHHEHFIDRHRRYFPTSPKPWSESQLFQASACQMKQIEPMNIFDVRLHDFHVSGSPGVFEQQPGIWICPYVRLMCTDWKQHISLHRSCRSLQRCAKLHMTVGSAMAGNMKRPLCACKSSW